MAKRVARKGSAWKNQRAAGNEWGDHGTERRDLHDQRRGEQEERRDRKSNADTKRIEHNEG